jgi:hypothetical protein
MGHPLDAATCTTEGGRMSWISVKDRLPEDEEITALVLISGDGWHDHDFAYYYSAKWYDKYDDIVEGVTHWQELPEPPKDEE